MSVKKTCVHCASTRIVFEGLCREHYLETVFTGQPLSPDVLEPLFFNPWSAASHRLSRDRHRRMFLATEGMCGLCLVMPPEVIDHDHKCCGIGYGCGRCVRGLVCVSCNNLLGASTTPPPALGS
ncbi:Recombination endonuclease VII [Clavibacter michiganensis subsp. michiganensis]|uniref:Recombination endonuclease VII n=1 Tax=Clavibacter michiganensis subsp. michiganensis TaxID=33013 RepID=A0A251XK69_CLAMM|nr:Recombination endonuclease VII [Clavibacter michiganensis subsp. michiganensis]OUE03583.1 Recombination endonuclease VII [Clavibacter michiganensis subsp. michiganensis]